MNPMDSQTSSSPGQASTAVEPQALGGDRKGPIVDLRSIDLRAVAYDKAEVERFRTPDWSHSVALQRVRGDEFWCAGHFPQKATMPGVIMVETAAQLSAFVFMAARNDPSGVLFLRIDHCAFRNSVHPGDDFYVLCQSIKMQRRRFITDVQGIVLRDGEQKITFGATLSGMTV
jgi:3-hydroxymyristoyl/3-hydroxydecanoyl-(acyl carrier protein) dehydratase